MDTSSYHTPQEQPAETATVRRRLSIGLPACTTLTERRFPLTPEGVKTLVEKGYVVKMESGAADTIHYTDNAYTRLGANVTDRASALACDIVINLAVPSVTDLRRMRRGAMLLTLLHLDALDAETVHAMQKMAIVGVAVDLVRDDHGNYPFSDILAEIDGRASIATASSLLADADHGKGILLGGVAGIVPCEVAIIGSGISAVAAARSASGLGAIVRMFDDDVYSLRAAVRDLGPQIIGSSLHERVLHSALRSADVVIVTAPARVPAMGVDVVDTMKTGVVIFDLNPMPGKAFPSLPLVNLALNPDQRPTASGRRVCYVNVGNSVPRTAAMALSNTFNTLLDGIVTCDGLTNALKLTAGLRNGVFTFLGKITNPDVARVAATRFTDINIFLQLS